VAAKFKTAPMIRKKTSAIRRRPVWKRAYRLGNLSGYRLGRCEAIMQNISKDLPFSWKKRTILYVTSGKGMPYSPLDHIIIRSIEPMVKELIVGTPNQDIADLASLKQPDLVLVLDGMLFPVEQVNRFRTLGIRTAVWLTDDPYYTDVTVVFAPLYDFVFTLELNCVPFYQNYGCAQVHYLPLGFCPSLYRPKQVRVSNRRDICFVGSGYWNRVHFFDGITPYLDRKNVCISGQWWERMVNYIKLKAKIRLDQWMGPEETADFYNGTKIVINLHRSYDDATFNNNSRLIHAVSPNPRTFEISGCGVLQLTDIRADLPRFYTPDKEIVTYGSAEELMHKIDYYLNHGDERNELALRGLNRSMREHTYTKRLTQLFCIVFGQT
jgi:spore maturation protein CgeB